MMSSLSKSTLKQYASALKPWINFCQETSVDTFNPEISQVLTFLNLSFASGASYGTLNSQRCVISLVSNSKVGDNPLITRFLKGCFKLKPTVPKYTHTWDVNVVLDYLEGMGDFSQLSPILVTEKVVTLLALVSAHRAQTLSLIRVDNITKTAQGLEILITDIIKTSAPSRSQPVIFLPRCLDRPNLCIASCVEFYIKMTSPYRGGEKFLFLSTRRPFKPVSSQTISKWIKSVLKKSGIDTEIFSGHSTRHASTSAALRGGVDIDIIRKTAGWSDKSKVFFTHYNRSLSDSSNKKSFAAALL